MVKTTDEQALWIEQKDDDRIAAVSRALAATQVFIDKYARRRGATLGAQASDHRITEPFGNELSVNASPLD